MREFTEKDLENILVKESELNVYGFGIEYNPRENVQQMQERLTKYRQHLIESVERVNATCRWIEENLSLVKTIYRERGSYGLKHIIEKDILYITNGQCIAAMLLMGYTAYRTRNTDPNCYFNISKKSMTAVFSRQNPDIKEDLGEWGREWKKHIDKERRRIKEKTKHIVIRQEPTFYSWLKQQYKRDDVVGDLARDTIQHKDKPKGKAGYLTWKWNLEDFDACSGALSALKEAWLEYDPATLHLIMAEEDEEQEEIDYIS